MIETVSKKTTSKISQLHHSMTIVAFIDDIFRFNIQVVNVIFM